MSLKLHWCTCAILLGILQLTQSVYFYCYRSVSLDDYEIIPVEDAHTIINKTWYKQDLWLFIYCFGYRGEVNGTSTKSVLKALLALGDRNVCLWNWEEEAALFPDIFGPAASVDYSLVVKLSYAVANKLAVAIANMVHAGLNILKLHLVGHSLGGQMMGRTGTILGEQHNLTVEKITALDPAGPSFRGNSAVTNSSGRFVLLLGTDPTGYGSPEPTGHVNIYPRTVPSGTFKEKDVQPGCEITDVKTELALGGGVWSLRNLSISVPRAVLSGEGESVVLRCSYDLEGAALYSIRWYRVETEFYRYVPREMPPSLVFPLPGTLVDLTQSDHQQVRVVNMHRQLSGEYQCEVSADAPLFHTDIRSAPLTVVDPPFRAPQISISRSSYARGDTLRANCSVDEAYPAPNITWILDDHKIAETISWRSMDMDFKERPAFSQLEISILEAEHYKMGLTYTSSNLNRAYQDHYVYSREMDKEDQEVLRYTLVPPPSGQFTLSCVATIFDIYARKSEPVYIKEDAPHPASVTGEDSSGTSPVSSLLLTSFCVYAALL